MQERTRPRYRSPRPKPRVIVRTINELIELLSRYRGGVIAKGKHPIHRKVVELERLLRVRVNDATSGQQGKLPVPLCNQWFSMLWASRRNLKELAKRRSINLFRLLVAFRAEVKSGQYMKAWKASKNGHVATVVDSTKWELI